MVEGIVDVPVSEVEAVESRGESTGKDPPNASESRARARQEDRE